MFTAIDNILNSTQLSGEAYFVAEHQGGDAANLLI